MDINIIVNVISELTYGVLQYCTWPIVTLIMVIVLARKLPDMLGAIQYKHLALMSSIKEYSYWLTDLVRRNTNREDKLDQDGIKAVYNILAGKTYKSDAARYDLNSFVKRYKAFCPKLSEVKLTKFNKKAKNLEEQKEAIYQYYDNWAALIHTVMTDEYLKGREDLSTLAASIGSIANLIK